MTHKSRNTFFFIFLTSLIFLGCQPSTTSYYTQQAEEWQHSLHAEDDHEDHEHSDTEEFALTPFGCTKPTRAQIAMVDAGNTQKDAFLQQCLQQTQNSPWCHQLTRPNPQSISTFRCTYGSSQVHQLIYPESAIWKHAIQGVHLIQQLTAKGIRVCEIYNWWRPEPYNKNVGGAAGRHPFGTAIDVRFCSNSDALKAFDELCRFRAKGQIRAIGYYGGSALHLGVGDKTANTWGRSCR